MPYSIETIGGEPSRVKFVCDKCGHTNNMVEINLIDENGNYRWGKNCCKQNSITNEVKYALQFIHKDRVLYQKEKLIKEHKENLYVYLIFGGAPLILGVVSGSPNLVSFGLFVTVIVLIIYWFGYLKTK